MVTVHVEYVCLFQNLEAAHIKLVFLETLMWSSKQGTGPYELRGWGLWKDLRPEYSSSSFHLMILISLIILVIFVVQLSVNILVFIDTFTNQLLIKLLNQFIRVFS